MSSGNANTISVEIMGRQHQFACPADQEEGLKKAANHLDTMFHDIKQQSSVGNNERALLVAALNLSYQLLKANNQLEDCDSKHSQLINKLQSSL